MKKLILILAMMAADALALPNGGRAVEYIKSDGYSWIDTGILPNQDTCVEMTWKSVNTISADAKTVFGANSGSYHGLQFTVSTYQLGSIGYGNSINGGWGIYSFVGGKIYHVKLDKNVFYVNDEVVKTMTYETFKILNTLHIFDSNNGTGSPNFASDFTVYSVKIDSSGILVRDYIPAVKDGVPCLYDKVSKTYFYNAGSGAFTAGPIVRESVSGIRTAFSPLGATH